MMDYCARESTLCDGREEPVERNMTTREIIEEIRMNLQETLAVLTSMRLSIEGSQAQERKAEEPKCLHDDVLMIKNMTVDAMGLSHAIMAKLFGDR